MPGTEPPTGLPFWNVCTVLPGIVRQKGALSKQIKSTFHNPLDIRLFSFFLTEFQNRDNFEYAKDLSPSPSVSLLKNISNLASNRRKWELRWMHSKNVSYLATRTLPLLHTHTHTYAFSHFKPLTRFASVLNISLGCTVRKMAGEELWPDQPVGCSI